MEGGKKMKLVDYREMKEKDQKSFWVGKFNDSKVELTREIVNECLDKILTEKIMVRGFAFVLDHNGTYSSRAMGYVLPAMSNAIQEMRH